jgi:ABC-type proline/glycine betaine transport system permease subunit
MKFTSAFAVVACAVVARASTVANVLTDIAKINTDVTNLDKLIVAFPNSGGSLAAALVCLVLYLILPVISRHGVEGHPHCCRTRCH